MDERERFDRFVSSAEWHHNARTGLGEVTWPNGLYLILEGNTAKSFDAEPQKRSQYRSLYAQAEQQYKMRRQPQ